MLKIQLKLCFQSIRKFAKVSSRRSGNGRGQPSKIDEDIISANNDDVPLQDIIIFDQTRKVISYIAKYESKKTLSGKNSNYKKVLTPLDKFGTHVSQDIVYRYTHPNRTFSQNLKNL